MRDSGKGGARQALGSRYCRKKIRTSICTAGCLTISGKAYLLSLNKPEVVLDKILVVDG